jgi:sugar fermentation stimulation protein A
VFTHTSDDRDSLCRRGEVRKGILLDRPNRFLGIVDVDGESVEAFIPNPGRMYELMVPGRTVYLRHNSARHRKTDFDMIAVEYASQTVSIDSQLPNKFIKRLLANKEIEKLLPYDVVKAEVPLYESRIDFKLEGKAGRIYIEVKSCTLVEDGHAFWPDAPTKRGTRHVRALARALREELATRSVVIIVIQRPDAGVFSPNDRTDPIFGKVLRAALNRGVELIPLTTKVVEWDLDLVGEIRYDLDYSYKQQNT